MPYSIPVARRSKLLEWCRVHVPVFVENAVQIGIPEETATEYALLFEDAEKALADALAARSQALSATMLLKEKMRELRLFSGRMTKAIRAHAELTTDPDGVYNTAMIEPPAAGSPIAPPAKPTDVSASLNANAGTLALRWKCRNPRGAAGTGYVVKRQLPGETQWKILGIARGKKFIDDTLPAGTQSARYQIWGQRGGIAGPPSPIFLALLGQTVQAGQIQNAKCKIQNAKLVSANI